MTFCDFIMFVAWNHMWIHDLLCTLAMRFYCYLSFGWTDFFSLVVAIGRFIISAMNALREESCFRHCPIQTPLLKWQEMVTVIVQFHRSLVIIYNQFQSHSDCHHGLYIGCLVPSVLWRIEDSTPSLSYLAAENKMVDPKWRSVCYFDSVKSRKCICPCYCCTDFWKRNPFLVATLLAEWTTRRFCQEYASEIVLIQWDKHCLATNRAPLKQTNKWECEHLRDLVHAQSLSALTGHKVSRPTFPWRAGPKWNAVISTTWFTV